ncbi:unnamed protein product, partial [Phaedon cochleariae]
ARLTYSFILSIFPYTDHIIIIIIISICILIELFGKMVILNELELSETFTINRERSELARKLANLTKKNGYEIIQTNGQRVYAPPASRKIDPVPKGCEVFIGKLHKNTFEDELVPLFEKIGPLYKFRLMLDFMEKTRGYAFATYFNSEDASRAVSVLNNYEIRPNNFIGVFKSVDNCRLFIGNVPADKTRREVFDMLCHYTEGVVDVIMYPHYDNPKLNRGFVFVEFENHRMAAMARRQFTPDNLILWDQPLYVDWADPVPDIDPQVMAKVTILYLRNLPIHYSTEEIQNCIVNLVGNRIVKKVHKIANFAFIHFVSRRSAEFAMAKLKNLIIANFQVGVEWARPRRYSKKNRLINPPENFCTLSPTYRSVPPNIRRLVHQRLKVLNGTIDGTSNHDGTGTYDGASTSARRNLGGTGSSEGGESGPRGGESRSPQNTATPSSSGSLSNVGSLNNSSRQDDSTDIYQQVEEYRHFKGLPIFYNYRVF